MTAAIISEATKEFMQGKSKIHVMVWFTPSKQYCAMLSTPSFDPATGGFHFKIDFHGVGGFTDGKPYAEYVGKILMVKELTMNFTYQMEVRDVMLVEHEPRKHGTVFETRILFQPTEEHPWGVIQNAFPVLRGVRESVESYPWIAPQRVQAAPECHPEAHVFNNEELIDNLSGALGAVIGARAYEGTLLSELAHLVEDIDNLRSRIVQRFNEENPLEVEVGQVWMHHGVPCIVTRRADDHASLLPLMPGVPGDAETQVDSVDLRRNFFYIGGIADAIDDGFLKSINTKGG